MTAQETTTNCTGRRILCAVAVLIWAVVAVCAVELHRLRQRARAIATFRSLRGFRAEVMQLEEPAGWATDLGELFDCMHLVEASRSVQIVELTGSDAGDEKVALLVHLPEVKELWLGHTSVTGNSAAAISACRDLETLFLERAAIKEGDLTVLSDLRDLENLCVTGTQFGNTDVAALKDLPIKLLAIRSTKCDWHCMPVLAGLTKLEHLQITGECADAAHPMTFARLEDLRIDFGDIPKRFTQNLSMPSLNSLSLIECNCAPGAFRPIAKFHTLSRIECYKTTADPDEVA